jgi:hypothetical protein
MEYGMFGAALSMNLTCFLNMVILDLLIYRSASFKNIILPHDKRSFSEWDVYLECGMYGAFL